MDKLTHGDWQGVVSMDTVGVFRIEILHKESPRTTMRSDFAKQMLGMAEAVVRHNDLEDSKDRTDFIRLLNDLIVSYCISV